MARTKESLSEGNLFSLGKMYSEKKNALTGVSVLIFDSYR